MAIFEDERHGHHSPGMRAARLLGLIFAVVLIAVVLSNPITLGAGVALAMLATVAVLCIAPRLLTNPPKLSSRPAQDTSITEEQREALDGLNIGPLKEQLEIEEPSPPPSAPTENDINANEPHLNSDTLEILKDQAEVIEGQEDQLKDRSGKRMSEQTGVAGRGDSMRGDNEHGLN